MVDLQIKPVGPRIDAALWLVAIVLIATGWFFARSTFEPARPMTALSGEVELTLPEGWASNELGSTYTASPASLGAVGASLSVTRVAVPADLSSPVFFDLELARFERDTAESGMAFRVLLTEENTAFGDHQCSWTHYAIVRDPDGAATGAAVLPVVVRGVGILVQTDDGRLYRVAAEAPADQFSLEAGALARAVRSLRIGGAS